MADEDPDDIDFDLPEDSEEAMSDDGGTPLDTSELVAAGGEDDIDFDDIDFPDDADFGEFGGDDDDDAEASSGGLKRWLIIGGSATAGIMVLGVGAILLLSGGDDTPPAPERPAIPVVSLELVKKKPPPAPKSGLTPPKPDAPASAKKPASLNAAGAARTASTGTLNSSGAGRAAPGVGIVVPAVAATAYGQTPPPPKAGPLAAPNTDLVENATEGALPQIASDGRQPWQEYKRPFTLKEGQRPIVIIMHGLGLSQTTTIAAIDKLPAEISLAFNVYAKGLRNWMSSARAQGHETLLSLPMEPNDFPRSDPGPMALKTDLETAENVARLRQVLSLAAGYVGVMNFLGSQFVTSEAALRPVLRTLRSRGLMYVDDGLIRDSKVIPIATAIGLPWARSNLQLDAEASRTGINRQLRQLELRARRGEVAVGIAEPFPVTIRQISTWLPTLAAKRLVLAPVSAVARTQAK